MRGRGKRLTVLDSQPDGTLSRSSDVPIQCGSVRIETFRGHLISMSGKSWSGSAHGSSSHDEDEVVVERFWDAERSEVGGPAR